MISIEQQLAKAQRELEEAKRKVESLSSVVVTLSEEQKFAEHLHSAFCHWNHMDGCGWEYDRGDWKEHSRQLYLEKARNAFDVMLGPVRDKVEIAKLYKFVDLIR